jgi:lipid-A-disaccharide synthase
MNDQIRTQKIFISAAEPSADAHCANLITALKKASFDPVNQTNINLEFAGIGGEKMAQAGCEIIEDPTSRAAMIYNAFSNVKYFFGLIKKARQYIENNEVSLVIVCDSPAFNFHIAKIAKKNDIRTLFYVAPQLWAWASWRIHKLKRLCDKLACILPFEKDWFQRRGVDTVFVGNPLFDEPGIEIQKSYKSYNDFDPRRAKIALFPGSRSAEIHKLWPAMQKICRKLSFFWPNMEFTACAPNEEKLELLKELQLSDFQCKYTLSDVPATASKSDFALTASGSATLQVASAGCPMIIMYQSSRILWRLFGQWLVRSRFLSLVNILAGRELVPEFMPYFTSITPIYKRAHQMLNNRAKLTRTSHDLVSMVEPLARENSSRKTAELSIQMLGKDKSEYNS